MDELAELQAQHAAGHGPCGCTDPGRCVSARYLAVIERLAGERDAMRDALESMVDHFAYDRPVTGQPGMCTGGLSALEEAFDVLGLDDPYVIDDPVWCDADVMPRCPKRVSCGGLTDDGYKHFCSLHFAALKAPR